MGRFRLLKNSYYLLIVIALSLTACVTDYYFKVNQAKYNDVLLKPEGIDPYKGQISFYNKMNWGDSIFVPMGSILFPNNSSNFWFNIEFLREPNIKYKKFSNDIGISNYLVSRIQFHPEITNIKDISVRPIYKGSELTKIGTYIYLNEELKTFSRDSIDTYENLNIYFIFDYPISKLKRFLLKKTSWFPNKLIEEISITYENNGEIETKVFQFELYWLYSSYWIT